MLAAASAAAVPRFHLPLGIRTCGLGVTQRSEIRWATFIPVQVASRSIRKVKTSRWVRRDGPSTWYPLISPARFNVGSGGLPSSLFSSHAQSLAFSVRTLVSRPESSRKKQGDFEDMTLWEQVRAFPANLKELYADTLTYFDIEAASKTSCNAWRGRVPRRQRAFQRWMEREIAKVALPVVGYVLVPVLGNIFILLACSSPVALVQLQQSWLLMISCLLKKVTIEVDAPT
mmetsp:Transcript_15227/g.44183  ORF Transcript_15227/g.44183 Transcript_15227/m.44183 type:complete len:230 (+) Transcript_15227:101-790(+)